MRQTILNRKTNPADRLSRKPNKESSSRNADVLGPIRNRIARAEALITTKPLTLPKLFSQKKKIKTECKSPQRNASSQSSRAPFDYVSDGCRGQLAINPGKGEPERIRPCMASYNLNIGKGEPERIRPWKEILNGFVHIGAPSDPTNDMLSTQDSPRYRDPFDEDPDLRDPAILENLGRSQTIPRQALVAAAREEDIFSENPNFEFENLIAKVQGDDPKTRQRIENLSSRKPGQIGWTLDSNNLLRFKERIFVNLQRDVDEYIATCVVYQGAKAPRHKPYGKFQPLPQPTRPWKEISLDFIIGLPPVI
ncbi:hypothetical protein N7495_002356 [Penicillium taxi]|uniref:uncharacterized protein n=1 Tax=Penicillium taxi TaxID=168475 RepID=UPI002545A8ED|nr:uncharacterized protein N7495_002356 [Penicillium taxi]KAJ5901828.1 hypothetical protein N7495_002356 [Penicillium taxi]